MNAPPRERPRYWLPAHVCGCPTASGAVLLDLLHNRYFALGTRETSTLFMLVPGWTTCSGAVTDPAQPIALDTAEHIADSLAKAGLLSREAPCEQTIAPAPIDVTGSLSVIGQGHPCARTRPPSAQHIYAFLQAYTWARRALRSRTLYSVAREILQDKAEKSPAPEFDVARATELVNAFRCLRPLAFAAQDKCLLHALALVKFLSLHQLAPAWVIGVRMRPWAAHSWVQHANLVLDTNPEHVCEFTPILAV